MVSSISQIPYWMYGVLIVLGWNEFVAIIRSPIYFTFLLLAGAGAFVVFQLNMVSFLSVLILFFLTIFVFRK